MKLHDPHLWEQRATLQWLFSLILALNFNLKFSRTWWIRNIQCSTCSAYHAYALYSLLTGSWPESISAKRHRVSRPVDFPKKSFLQYQGYPMGTAHGSSMNIVLHLAVPSMTPIIWAPYHCIRCSKTVITLCIVVSREIQSSIRRDAVTLSKRMTSNVTWTRWSMCQMKILLATVWVSLWMCVMHGTPCNTM